MNTVSPEQRSEYLLELSVVLNAKSVWLLRDFLSRWAPVLGQLGMVIQSKGDEELRHFIDEVALARSARSDNQLATQLCSPWLLPGTT